MFNRKAYCEVCDNDVPLSEEGELMCGHQGYDDHDDDCYNELNFEENVYLEDYDI